MMIGVSWNQTPLVPSVYHYSHCCEHLRKSSLYFNLFFSPEKYIWKLLLFSFWKGMLFALVFIKFGHIGYKVVCLIYISKCVCSVFSHIHEEDVSFSCGLLKKQENRLGSIICDEILIKRKREERTERE